MTHKVQFLGLEEGEIDTIVSFAMSDPKLGIKSLILHRQPSFEQFLEDKDRGVVVSMEGEDSEREDFNILKSIRISEEEVWIKSTFKEYHLDISMVDPQELEEMKRLLKKLNFDDRFKIRYT